MTARLSRQYVKYCDARDFLDERFLRVARELIPERDPATHVERKVWEFAMCALFLADVGRLDEGTEALAVGAGDERMVFWLANRLGRVVATDIYGTGEFRRREAGPSMLERPQAHAPFPYREDRLEVRWMDGRQLDFPDDSFDAVISISSIEHFGGPRDVGRAAAEIGRVLRPGGHAFIATECFVRKNPLYSWPVDWLVKLTSFGRLRRRARWRRRGGVDVLTARELERWIVRPSGLRLLQPFDSEISPETWRNLTRARTDGTLLPASGAYWPHLLLAFRRSVFTSVCLVLEKGSR